MELFNNVLSKIYSIGDKFIEFLFEDFSIKLTKNESEIIVPNNPNLQKEFSNIKLESNQSLCDFIQLIKHMHNNNYDLLCSIEDGIKSLSVITAAFLSNNFNSKISIPVESKFHDMELAIGWVK